LLIAFKKFGENMNIAFVGTGILGFPMAERLIKAGYNLIAYNRNIKKAMPLTDIGAKVTDKIETAVQTADTIILMLSDFTAIKDVLFQKDLLIMLKGKCVIQMGTISPEQSIELQDQLKLFDCEYFEAPVLGSINEVKNQKLIIMFGSTKEQYKNNKNLLSTFGSKLLYIGEVGKAAAIKLALNQLIASLTAAFSTSLAYIQKSGIDPDVFMEIVRGSAIYAPTYDKKLAKMLKQDFKQANFPVQHLLKDVELMKNEAESSNIESALLEALVQIIRNTLNKGYKDQDYSAIFMGIYDRR
jgi:3-hydroxyisobutyrate dehydrogenase